MKKKILTLFFMASALCFAESKYNIENLNIKEKNGLYYKQDGEKKKILNEESVIFSKENSKLSIFEIDFQNGEIKKIKFSNQNNYFSPQNKEEKINFNLKRISKENFNGNIEYKKEKSEEVKKNEKTENSTMTFYSSSSASSQMSFSGDFKENKVNSFFNKFLESNKNNKVIIKKAEIDDLISKK